MYVSFLSGVEVRWVVDGRGRGEKYRSGSIPRRDAGASNMLAQFWRVPVVGLVLVLPCFFTKKILGIFYIVNSPELI